MACHKKLLKMRKSPVFRGFCLGVERFFGAGAIGSGSSYMSNCGSQCIEAVHESSEASRAGSLPHWMVLAFVGASLLAIGF
jgi:hypothetical protein